MPDRNLSHYFRHMVIISTSILVLEMQKRRASQEIMGTKMKINFPLTECEGTAEGGKRRSLLLDLAPGCLGSRWVNGRRGKGIPFGTDV